VRAKTAGPRLNWRSGVHAPVPSGRMVAQVVRLLYLARRRTTEWLADGGLSVSLDLEVHPLKLRADKSVVRMAQYSRAPSPQIMLAVVSSPSWSSAVHVAASAAKVASS
jgi:hypothetical protein